MKIQVSHGVHFKNFKGPLELQAIFFFVSILISTAIACFEALFIRLLAPSNICSTVQKTRKMYKLGGYKRQFREHFKGASVHHQHHIHFIQVYFLSFWCIFNKTITLTVMVVNIPTVGWRVCNSPFILILDLFLSSLERETRAKKVDTSKLNTFLKWLCPNVSFQSSIFTTYCIWYWR